MPTMFIVSCRKDFWSASQYSDADEIRRIELGTGVGATVSTSEFLQEVGAKRLTVLIHGYNNEELDILNSYGTIDAQMRLLGFLGGSGAAYDALVGFVWPAGTLGVSFPFARQRASDTAPRFGRLLATLRRADATIDLNTHSLGAHVAFEALRDGTPYAVRNAWNFASAVDNESIELGKRYYQSAQRCERFFVFHSKHDPVLRVWYRIGDFFDFDTALGYSGPENPADIINHAPHVRVINCKEVVHSHGGYRKSGQVWAYMSQELTSPSPEQFVTLPATPQALNAVFKATGGTAPSAVASGGSRRARASAGSDASAARRGRRRKPR